MQSSFKPAGPVPRSPPLGALRGLLGGSSLSKLLKKHRGVCNRGGHWKRSEPS